MNQTNVKLNTSLFEKLQQEPQFDGFSYKAIAESLLILQLPEKDQPLFLKIAGKQTAELVSQLSKRETSNYFTQILNDLDVIQNQIDGPATQVDQGHVSNDMLMHMLTQMKYMMMLLVSIQYRPDVPSSKFDENPQVLLYALGNNDNKKSMYLEKLFSKISTNMFLTEVQKLSQNKAVQKLNEENGDE